MPGLAATTLGEGPDRRSLVTSVAVTSHPSQTQPPPLLTSHKHLLYCLSHCLKLQRSACQLASEGTEPHTIKMPGDKSNHQAARAGIQSTGAGAQAGESALGSRLGTYPPLTSPETLDRSVYFLRPSSSMSVEIRVTLLPSDECK